MSLALLFPGQGSQFVGMGRDLADAFPVASRTFEEADDLLGTKLSTLSWEGPAEELTLTRNAQPAILIHSVAMLRVARDELGPVACAAGHSLGEFSAWVAAGTLSFPDALRAVRFRGEQMFAAGELRPGSMAALLGLEDSQADALCREASIRSSDIVVTANFNSPGQVVVSGDVTAIERILEMARESGAKKVIPLSVSGAFHSPLMKPAQSELEAHLGDVEFSEPAFPVISNVTARPVTDPGEARELLVEQLTSPVRWAESVQAMVEMGVDRFVELGPGNVLTGLNRRNAKGVPSTSLQNPADLEAFLGR
ncbi:MAG: [acyl-carrier-protein] S-malonyltransferase [Gemmatimonadales bacterium]|nr:MAG: [acyl-carrier-protein] S-malonyltransferase [Gemmatimonadales bacterium]